MVNTQKVWKIKPRDNRIGMVYSDEEDFERIDSQLGNPVGNKWIIPKLELEEYSDSTYSSYTLSDIETWVTGELILSSKSLRCLRDILDSWIELLPVISPDGATWYLCNITKTIDALDLKHSKITYVNPKTKSSINAIVKCVFNHAVISNVSIFRMPRTGIKMYATEKFVNRVRECGLSGLEFISPHEIDYRKMLREIEKKEGEGRKKNF